MNRVAQNMALAASLICLPWLMGADVYRWVDANGVVNYTQQRPIGVESELVEAFTAGRSARTRKMPANPGAAATTANDTAPGDLSPEQQSMLDDLKRIETDRQQEITKIKKDNCQRAKRVLDKLTQIGRIRLKGDDGKERVLTEPERQQRIEEAQRGVAANCPSIG